MPALGELAARLGGRLAGPAGLALTGIAPIETAGPDQLTFVTEARYLSRLAASRAAAVVLQEGWDAAGRPAIHVADARRSLPALLACFAPPAPDDAPRIAPSAFVHPRATVAPDAVIGPGCVIEQDARIGAGSRLIANVFVGERCELGARVLVHAGAVIGSDGFGFLPGPEGAVKIPQIGRVLVGDDVEIGANCTIDRGTVGDTVLGRGVKLDNQVHLAHNVTVGAGALLAGQTAVAGTVTIGRGVMTGGQVGIADHVTVGDGAQIGAQTGVAQDVPAGARLFGTPARDVAEALRINAALARLPALLRKVRELEARLAALEQGRTGA